MFLTRDEEAILNGEYGEALETAMTVLVKLGDMYNADRMIDISNAHIDAASYATIYDSGLEFCEFLSNSGAVFKVPTTLNPSAIDFERWMELRLPVTLVKKQLRLKKAYMKMGAYPTWTCTPYHCNASIRFGQNIAWGESNAVIFANSVIGARTNRYGDLVDICAAVLGRVPRFGLYLDENRVPEVFIEIERNSLKNFSCTDYASLGFLIGSIVDNRIPLISGIPSSVTIDQLKSFGAALATSSSIPLFHICNVTPEAIKLCESINEIYLLEKISLELKDLRIAEESLNTAGAKQPDIIALGCPHYSVEQLNIVAKLIKGKHVKRNIEFWIFTSRVARDVSDKMGILDIIEKSGIKVFVDTCFLYLPLNKWDFKFLMTDSAKMAYYASGLTNMEVIYGDIRECIRLATE